MSAGEKGRSDEAQWAFVISTAKIVEKDDSDNKHVVYTLKVRHASNIDDDQPVSIHRRYTHFHNMYTALCKEFPDLMSSVYFPKKVLIGNFKDDLILYRSTGFENLLNYISTESKLTYSGPVLSFLQDIELAEAKVYMNEKRYDVAIPILEDNFHILSKIYTDRSKPVLLSLCRLLGVTASTPGTPKAQKWAELALYRFEGVSDSDLLALYVPLLHLCIKLFWQREEECAQLKARLDNMNQRGMRVTNVPSLLESVASLE